MKKSAKRGARAKSAKTRTPKDLTARSGQRVTGGRQTPRTDFGVTLRDGLVKTADAATNTSQA